MKREGCTFAPTPEDDRAQEIANQKAIAAHMNAMVARFKNQTNG